ncbi:hypothetical protein L484_005305 [Morus notabilis]|uniref:RNase H type-1 domain-containing protein n=1 Tax=Morus notabilis TaxID=981085 RepID=W9QPU8_9ROSA|nr:hypothetical protein L484_005305 [Morus notabilis]
MLKLNVDASVPPNGSFVGVGFYQRFIRLLRAFSKQIHESFSPFVAECMAIREGLLFTRDSGLHASLVGNDLINAVAVNDALSFAAGFPISNGIRISMGGANGGSCTRASHQSNRWRPHRRVVTEYRSLANVVAEITWLMSLLKELRVEMQGRPVVWCDNLSTVQLAANPVSHARTKHVELDLYLFEKRLGGTGGTTQPQIS